MLDFKATLLDPSATRKATAIATLCLALGGLAPACKQAPGPPPAPDPAASARPQAQNPANEKAPAQSPKKGQDPARGLDETPKAGRPLAKSQNPDSPGQAAAKPAPAKAASSYPSTKGQAGPIHYIERVAADAATADLPVLVMIHGLGDKPENFIHLSDSLQVPHRALALRGIFPYDGSFGNGHAWFRVRVKDKNPAKLGAGITHAADEIAKGLVALNKRDQTPERRFIVTGFSQGGMLSYAMALLHPELVATALPVSGLLPPTMLKPRATKAPKPRLEAFHGQEDTIVPASQAKATVAWMKSQHQDATLKLIPKVGHRIPPPLKTPYLHALTQAIASTQSDGDHQRRQRTLTPSEDK